MNRSVSKWAKCNPEAMSKQSQTAIYYAFDDAKKDILEMAKMLCIVAYPRRGTEEEDYNRYQLAELIQDNFSLDDIDEDR